MRGRLLALYASITVGNSPCHKFTHVEGHSGGFYHIVCPHSVSVHCLFHYSIFFNFTFKVEQKYLVRIAALRTGYCFIFLAGSFGG